MAKKTYEIYKLSNKNTVPEIPNHWDTVKLKWVTRFSYGDSLATETREDGDVPVYGSNGIIGLHTSSITKVPCIIIGRKGSYGKINYSEKSCFPIDTTYFIDERSSKNNIRWLFYVLQNLGLDEYSQDSAVPGLSREYAYSIELPYPKNLEEQQAIAQFLDHKTALIDQYIANKQRQLQLLEKLRMSIISEAVTQGLNSDVAMRETEVEWLGKIPRHWQLKKIKYLGRFQGGGTPSKENAGFWNGTIPWVSPKDMGSAFITDSEDKITEEAIRKSATNLIKSGAIVLVMRSGILRRAIPVAILSIDATLNQDMKAIIPREEIIPEYLLYLIHGNQSKLLVEWVKEGSTVESIEYKLFADTKFPVPPIEEEQQAIINFIKIELGRVDTLVNQLNQQISKMEAYRASLISEAVSGKIDVRDFQLPATATSSSQVPTK